MTHHLPVALITGAARRIGAEIAVALHQIGINVVLHYNVSEKEALHLCEELNENRPHSATVVNADLSNTESTKCLIEQAVASWGRLDVLINNASRFYRSKIGAVTDFEWQDLLNTNLKAPFFLSQAAAPHLAKHKGVIVNITDIHAERPVRDYAVYCISKGGLTTLTKVLAKELGPDVRVNAVAPGAIIWPEGENSLSEGEKQKIIDRILLQRVGAGVDIAKAVLFFVRDASYVTGQVIAVDGGRSI